ncbi:hypothetical protein BX600DRAFT_506412 [Xylariales sp. PMI_506]|nr:hypothetical protein BX600DRAFT_506412 [Xylariales sp. PMI_506]
MGSTGCRSSPASTSKSFDDMSGLATRVHSPILGPVLLSDMLQYRAPPTPDNGNGVQDGEIHARAYQMEMFRLSLDENIIVVMDTGSGKTQVAVLRIQAELETAEPGDLIWFLVPTVVLCEQQLGVLKAQIPGAEIKKLTGSDGVDTWSSTAVWDLFLKNANVVISTYQILLDALTHRFVRMETLSLIVIDEAHYCVGNSPGSKIMKLYREAKEAHLLIPAILGLTASPIINPTTDALNKIESTLDATCKTPSIHRAELLQHVERPNIRYILYKPTPTLKNTDIYTAAMLSLHKVRQQLDISEDPYVLQQLQLDTELSRNNLDKAIMAQDTYCFNQLKTLCNRSRNIRCELGAWAADYFIYNSITQFLDLINQNDKQYETWAQAEKLYLGEALKKVQLPILSMYTTIEMTDKATRLIQMLQQISANTRGIIFVKEANTAYMLARLLSVHPLTLGFKAGAMVGLSRYISKKADIGEMKKRDCEQNLAKFRTGELDFLISTSVVEEGVDVPACNLVICFNECDNLKSYIQRRGRARSKSSDLVLFYAEDAERISQWEALEDDMKREYSNEEREIKKLSEFELADKSALEPFYTREKGAKLDFESAKSHLEHFCAVATSRDFVNSRPYYITAEITSIGTQILEKPLFRATVVLPNLLPGALRRVNSSNMWPSEKNAFKDAAFQAYVKLYQSGLVDEHLMPLKAPALLSTDSTSKAAISMKVNQRCVPWSGVARAWSMDDSHAYHGRISLFDGDKVICEFGVSLPVPIPNIPAFNVFWNQQPWKVVLRPNEPGTIKESITGDDTMTLIALAYGHRFEVPRAGKHVIRFHSMNGPLSMEQLGSREINAAYLNQFGDPHPYLIRNPRRNGVYFFDKWLTSEPSAEVLQKVRDSHAERLLQDNPTDGPWLALKKWPRRQDFLHHITDDSVLQGGDDTGRPYYTAWPASICRADSTPIINAQFGSLIPSITHMAEIYLVARILNNTVPQDLKFRDVSLLVTALSASSAKEATDYQRLEFLGDCILKLMATLSVAVNYPDDPEGYLDLKRQNMVSNASLCASAIKAGLDRFILDEPFTGNKWRPIYVDDYSKPAAQPPERFMSAKVLADVLEALIGASYQEGGMDKVLRCLRHFIPNIVWHDLELGRLELARLDPPQVELPPVLAQLEKLLGYTFSSKKLLLEAVTHASYDAATAAERSLGRLEFVGDAVLDKVIVAKLWSGGGGTGDPGDLTLLRAACVNADFLGFLAMEYAVERETSHIVDGKPVPVRERLPFWTFMRHTSQDLGAAQRAAAARHEAERRSILAAMADAPAYPWAALAHLGVPKFFSDLFESVLGAVWVDSGSFAACDRLVAGFGIAAYLSRIRRDGVDVEHPKNKLSRLAQQREVRYEIIPAHAASGPGSGLACRVFVGGQVVAEVGGGVNQEEIKTKAAMEACEVLKRLVLQ